MYTSEGIETAFGSEYVHLERGGRQSGDSQLIPSLGAHMTSVMEHLINNIYV